MIRAPAAAIALLLAAASLVSGGCTGDSAVRGPTPDGDFRGAETVWLASNGWHIGIVIERRSIPRDRVPEAAELPDGPYLEFGWGDRTYYPADDPTAGMALAAALTPTPAVMHVAARGAPPAPRPPDIEVLAVAMNPAAVGRLVDHIDAAFERPPGGPAEPLAPGLYENSLFFPAHGTFHLFNTCNTWVVRALRAAGVPVSPSGVIEARDAIKRLRAIDGVSVLEAAAG